MKYESLSVEQLTTWAKFNDVQLNGISIAQTIRTEAGKDKGGGLLAETDFGPREILLTVPGDLVVSSAQVDQQMKIDRHLREVLQALGPSFLQNARKKILIFLLMQLTHSCPDISDGEIGVTVPLTDYVRFLPKAINLPTFYTETVQEMLPGTSLSLALSQKLKSLEQEFDQLRMLTETIAWCRKFWWDEEDGHLTLSDWKLVDAMYRSRALELPRGMGDSMVPVLDMANHAPVGDWNARFDVDEDGNVLLVVCDDKHIRRGEEITIMYGQVGACEMIFSYGFIEEKRTSAEKMLISLTLPDDDPLALVKTRFALEAPGIRIHDDLMGHIGWESSFVWWACINEEDGLDFQVVSTNNGERELQATWKGVRLEIANDLAKLLANDPQKDVFELRANVLVQQRVELQGQELSESQHTFDTITKSDNSNVEASTVEMIRKLRVLELDLLLAAYQQLEMDKTNLMSSDAVRSFLSEHSQDHLSEGENSDDFS